MNGRGWEVGLFDGVGETEDFVVAGKWGVETDVYPAIRHIDTFRLQPNGVEVDGMDFLTRGKVEYM